MSSFLVNIVSGLTPPPFLNPPEYDGWEARWRFLVFRPACAYDPFSNHQKLKYSMKCSIADGSFTPCRFPHLRCPHSLWPIQ